MSFNPSLPASNSEMRSEEMRNQFNGLKDLIDWNTLPNKPTPVANGTYTIGTGTAQNGTITVVGGIITAVQQASDIPPDLVATGFGDADCNGGYFEDGALHGFPRYRTATGDRWLIYLDASDEYFLSDSNDGFGVLLYLNHVTGTDPLG